MKIIKYIISDIIRNKIMLAYTVLLLAISLSVFNLEDNKAKGLLSLMSVILIVVPLVSIIFATIYIYNSAEFIELLVSQPLKRTRLLLSVYSGLAISLLLAFLIGSGIPVLIYSPSIVGGVLIAVGMGLTLVFASLAILASVLAREKAKGMGIAILLWFYFSLIYDGIVLFILFQFSDYPLEKASIVFSSLNPIDLGRVVILLKMDVSAMMGYTGAVFKEFFGGNWGSIYSGGIILAWIVAPLYLSVRRFNRKDL
ncbi:MAG: ABC transporter permease subunit [Bacteroidota bacterium]|nr:ABC transporter permease subunit [Bacteroidota bacterium]MDP4216566.1 ABC transporter permease subunit [Bacteroidota bacterium]MDP4245030.1 ABC transporter permease subunit [Bacteroidota bacterium]MDP4252865.1 ABC transporter permease subunit [Bacteroidota bacterium]MDP4259857.1 ABC transporter permease subunit [Bacteroidota bacterium]